MPATRPPKAPQDVAATESTSVMIQTGSVASLRVEKTTTATTAISGAVSNWARPVS
ncbi:hypothetical protein ACFYZ8_35625 [Streptomyces sp. NPDC001668]|uniref:hypothetical protein n=1 Tax=unclassified Streptomyces TaxID=2593676 RepID=UPI0036BBBE0A